MRNLDEQMDLFNPRSSNFEPIEPLPKNPITGEPELTEPFDPELLAKSKRDVRKAPIDIAEGAITAPITAAGDIVDLGAMLPDTTPEQALISPTYAAIEETFDILARAGISRDNAVKLINDNTPINLEDNIGEFVGEAVGVTATGVAKAATGLAKIASKYGDEAGKYLSEIGDELGDMFRAATPGGDDFDGMAPVTVNAGTRIIPKADFQRPTIFKIYGGVQGKKFGERADLEEEAIQEALEYAEQVPKPGPRIPSHKIGKDITNISELENAVKRGEIKVKIPGSEDYYSDEEAIVLLKNQVFRRSGIFKGEDGKTRFEINTGPQNYGFTNFFEERLSNPFGKPGEPLKKISALFEGDGISITEIIDFPELFENYPHLKNYKLEILPAEDIQKGVFGHHDVRNQTIRVNPSILPTSSGNNHKTFLSTILHELEHAVDSFEGRQAGANPAQFLPRDFDMSNDYVNILLDRQVKEAVKNITDDDSVDNLFQMTMPEIRESLFTPGEAVPPEETLTIARRMVAAADDAEAAKNFDKRARRILEYGEDRKARGTFDKFIKSTDNSFDMGKGFGTYQYEELEYVQKYESPLDSAKDNSPWYFALSSEQQDFINTTLKNTVSGKDKLLELEIDANLKYGQAGGEVDAREVEVRSGQEKQFSKERSAEVKRKDFRPSDPSEPIGAEYPGNFKDRLSGYKGKDLNIIDYEGRPISASKLTEKSPLRVLFDELPETERAMLPPQPDANRLYGYHGTASARGADEPFFDINFARTNDQFLGEGFYFTLDPEIASEYASLRSIGRNFEKTIKGDAARKILTTPNVQKEFVGGLGKDVSVHVTPGGDYVTVGSIMKGKNIYGEDIAQGQYVGRFDLSNLKKPYVVRTEKQRKELKKMIPQLKEEGYDSILFADFKDRSKQIMVFPEHMDKIDTSAIAGRSASAVTETPKEMISVFPKPERMFPEGDRPKGGDYLNPQTGEVLSGRNVSSANIKINPDGKPSFKVSNDDVETIGSTGKGKSNIRVNLFKKKAGWKWDSAPTNYANVETLVSVEHKGKHYYTIETDFTSGVNLKKYPDSKTEPRLRPTLIGSIELGEPVGTISVRGKQHPVYSQIKTFNKGGVVSMDRQMSMFEDGGLMDEGGTIDPVSGNDVPPGSTQEEVRDDIPAQLSEGEFVFPADVVRYWGLDTLMRMRQQAKMGLRMMEEMGQMGNSEEATIPDDIPFDINDLDMEDEPEYNVGGFVPANQQQQEMGISGYQAAPMPTTSFATQPVQAASQQFVQPVSRPAQAYVPVQTTPTPLPTFGQITGPGVPEVDYEFATFRNEAGQEIQLRIKKGSRGELLPGEVLPEGYSWVDPEATQTEEVTTMPTTPQTTRVTETKDEDKDDGLGPGGGRIGMGGFSDGTGRKQNSTIMGVSFDMGEGFMGNTLGVGATALGLATGKGIPKEATATFTYDNATYTVSGDEYNDLKKAGYTGELADKIVASLKTESGINRNTVEYDSTTGTFKDKRSGEIFQDRDDDNDGIGDILNKAGQSIYSKVDKNDLLGSARKMNDSQKAVASAYNDKQFEMFDFGGGSDSNSGQSSASGTTKSSGADWSGSSSSSGTGSGTGYDRDTDRGGGGIGGGFDDFRAKGGLIDKPKPKAKKMKRGGLASKK